MNAAAAPPPPPPQATTTPVPTDRPPNKQLRTSLASLDISSPQSLALSDIDDSNRDMSVGGSSTDEENVMNYAEFDPVQIEGEHGTGNDLEGGCDGVPVLDVVGGEGGGSVLKDGPPFDDDDVESLGFPPGHVVHISDVSRLSRRRGDTSPVSSVNPSILPTYFFCPLTGYMMTDPVVTPSGTTYERRAVLRHLVLRPGRDPLDGRPLGHEELEEDRMVRRAIDKARKEAWIRYVADFDGGPGGGAVGAGEVDAVRGAAPVELHGSMEGEEDANVAYTPDGPGGTMLQTDPGDELLRMSIGEGEARRASGIIIDDDGEYEDLDLGDDSPSPETIRGGPRSPPSLPEKDIVAVPDSSSRSSVYSTLSNGMGNHDDVTESLAGHGWSVPLGVHRITAPGGLVVTQDVHRRSGVVQRRVVRRSLAEAGGGGQRGGDGGRSRKKIKMRRLRPRKQRHGGELRTVESVLTSDLVLPEGSHVEVTETRVHGGRVRGHVVWEEEVAARIDPELALRLEEEAVRRRAAAPPPPSNPSGARRGSMKKLKSFKRMNSGGSFKRRTTAGSAGSVGPSNPFTQDLFDRPPTHGASGGGGGGGASGGDAADDDGADDPIETVEYRGWVSLCWVGGPSNHDRDETVRRTRRRRRGGTATAAGGEAAPASDEDEGPWTSPLALGVYRVVSAPGQGHPRGQGSPLLPLHDSAGGGEIVDHLGPGRCFEVVETQVVLARGRGHRGVGGAAAPPPAVRRVRARCMVPTLRRRVVVGAGGSGPASSDGLIDEVVAGFRGGWITLRDGPSGGAGGTSSASAPSASAAPVPLGAYVVAGAGPLPCTDAGGRNVKGTLPVGSVMEVDTTRIEFADDVGGAAGVGEGGGDPPRTGRVAVRALIASGGYVTLFTCPADPTAANGGVGAADPPDVRAEPVPLGTYRVVSSTGLTQGIGHGTRLLAELRTNAFVRAVETRVENGCVRGRIDAVLFEQSDGGVVRDTIAGWVNLFQPPSYRWAELSSVESGAR